MFSIELIGEYGKINELFLISYIEYTKVFLLIDLFIFVSHWIIAVLIIFLISSSSSSKSTFKKFFTVVNYIGNVVESSFIFSTGFLEIYIIFYLFVDIF